MALDLTAGATTPPPARKTPGTSGRQNARAASAERYLAEKREERADGVNGLFQLGAFGFLMFGQVADAGACAQHGDTIAQECAGLAENNERVAKVVDYITALGPFAALLAAVLPFGLQLLLNHGKIPNVPMLAQMGVLPPEMMQQRAQLEMQRQQAAMMEQMRQAQITLDEQQAAEAARQAERDAA